MVKEFSSGHLNAIDGTNPYDDGTSKNYRLGKARTILNSSVAGYINTAKANMDSGFTSLSTLHERRGENALDVNNKKRSSLGSYNR